MPVQQQLANYVQTTLASGCTNVATTINVVSAAGLPTAGNFMLRIDDPAPATTFEIVECTGVSGTTLTVTRGQEGTTGIAHNAGAFVGNDITAAMLQRAFPLGMLVGGYSAATANQGPFTTDTALTNMSVTVTVGANRRIRITVFGNLQSTVAGDDVFFSIKEGASFLQQQNFDCPRANFPYPGTLTLVLTPTAGSHTYFASASRNAGTGNITFVAASTSQVPYILVEDIGQA